MPLSTIKLQLGITEQARELIDSGGARLKLLMRAKHHEETRSVTI